MNSKTTSTLAVLTALALSVSIFWYFKDFNGGSLSQNKILTSTVVLSEQAKAEMVNLENKIEEGSVKKYSHPNLSFSFVYPTEMKLREAREEYGEVVIIESVKGELGLQIVVSSFDEEIVLTTERIKADLPNLSMSNEQSFVLADREGATFVSENMREIWVVKDGYLYQISGYAGGEALMSKILATWQW